MTGLGERGEVTGSGLGQGHSWRLWGEEGGGGRFHTLPVPLPCRPARRNLTQGGDRVDFVVVDDGCVVVVVVVVVADGCIVVVVVDDEAVAVVAQFMFGARSGGGLERRLGVDGNGL